MSHEGLPKNESLRPEGTREEEHERLLIKNNLQINLIARYFGPEDGTDERFNEWIDNYSEKFRKIFDREYEKNPNFIDSYNIDDNVILQLEQELYKKEDPSVEIAA